MAKITLRPAAELAAAVADPSTEWLVTNGLGGYAFGTVSGLLTRGYHGYLISSLPAPLGRWMMLNDLIEHLHFEDGTVAQLGGEERAGLPFQISGSEHITDFHLETGLPVWRYDIQGAVLEKRVVMPHRQNTVLLCYRLVSSKSKVHLRIRPSLQFRPHNSAVNQPLDSAEYVLLVADDRYEVMRGSELPPLRFRFAAPKGVLTVDRIRLHEVTYRLEEMLGYPAHGELWSPGYFSADLTEREVVLTASTEIWEVLSALSAREAIHAEQERRERLLSDATRSFRKFSPKKTATLDRTAKELVLAADQFLVKPAGRMHHEARAQAEGDELCSVIAGYPWFTDWGRDTMISLEGLTLTTGRLTEASWILRTFAHSIHKGLIPNLFPERQREGLYNTADATLWFFHAINRYLNVAEDRSLLRTLLPKLEDIVSCHIHGTRFGIKVDPSDGLLTQGDPDFALTWMDAKKDDWIVTPRRGKAVEINALWYNALCVLEGWLQDAGRTDAAQAIHQHAERARTCFNERFWNDKLGHLFDIVDGPNGNDPACRPNQLLAISLPHPVLDESRWKTVVDICERDLLTPVGLRSLSPHDPAFRSTYEGDLENRDGAYHQGTVWAWLIGPFIDAWMKVYPGRHHEARSFLSRFPEHFGEAGLGSISEIFDAQEPHTPRACIAQAWSVAEVLRCWALTAGGAPRSRTDAVQEAN